MDRGPLDTVAQFIGYKDRNELLSKPFDIAARYVDPKDREIMISLLEENGEFKNFETRLKRNDDSIIWIRYSAKIVYEKGWIEGVSEDITDQKQAEISLRESEEKFSKFFFASPTWMAITRFKNGVILEVNKAFENITGFSRKEVIGRTSLELGLWPEPRRRERYMALAREKGGFREQETTFYAKDGKPITALWSAYAIELAGERCLLSTAMDISELKRSRDERKKLENRLHRAQKMEAMGLLAGGVAHDLNNILSGIVSYPELLLMDLPQDSPLRKPIQTIKESGMRAAEVVEDLLTIARGVAPGKEALNLNTVVNEYLNSPEFENLERTYTFVHFNPELEPGLLTVNGSTIHIKKVLMNLVHNATEAIDKSGTVTIRTCNRHLDEPISGYEDVRQGEYAVLTVSDDGSGITPQDIERIFEPFYTKKVMNRSGTGLGLAVVWNTVQNHNGYINVKSDENGTVFELYFPVTREKIADEMKAVDLEDYLGSGEKILVVDDEDRQRDIVCKMLTKLGYNPVAVSSGEEAIVYLTEHKVDLIVLDMVMPKGINGRETYEEIVRIRPNQKAIIASGYAKTEEVEAAQELGAGKYIKKPYTFEKLGITIKKELEG
ncbi:MAG: PAS domain S-box protein [Deltaproteobacteria bacterium]|nr:PAS domain S-box protein [Deltaproteobacteria bacterium]